MILIRCTCSSLVHPAAQLGLYTIKSTPGLMSRHGIVTGSYYHDTPGPLVRTIKDAAILLDIMKGADKYDNLTYQAIGHYPEDGYASKVVGKDALRGMKLGLPWAAYWKSNSVCCTATLLLAVLMFFVWYKWY